MAIRWRRVPELRLCDRRVTRRNVADPTWESHVMKKMRKVMWQIRRKSVEKPEDWGDLEK